MDRYWKAYGALAGSILGVVAAHGVLPTDQTSALAAAINTVLPVVGAVVGTIISPKNAP